MHFKSSFLFTSLFISSTLIFPVLSFSEESFSEISSEAFSEELIKKPEINSEKAEINETVALELFSPNQKSYEDSILLATSLKSIVLIGDLRLWKEKSPSIQEGLNLVGLKIPGNASAFTMSFNLFLQKPLTPKALNDLYRELITYFYQQKKHVSINLLSDQDLSSGVLYFTIEPTPTDPFISQSIEETVEKEIAAFFSTKPSVDVAEIVKNQNEEKELSEFIADASSIETKKIQESLEKSSSPSQNQLIQENTSTTLETPSVLPISKPEELILLDHLQTLILLSSSAEIEKISTKDLSGFQSYDLSIPNEETLQEEITSRYINKPLCKSDVLKIKNTILSHYRDEDRNFVQVYVPEQNITDKKLILVVQESTLGEISVKDNVYFSDRIYKSYLDIHPGDVIKERKILYDITLINRSPFRRANVIFSPGKAPLTTDVEILVKELKPFRIYFGNENTGLPTIGNDRWILGINLGNCFYLDQILSYQFTVSRNGTGFRAHTFEYTIPLPWNHFINFYGGFAKVKTDIPVFPSPRSHGNSIQASTRYAIPLQPGSNYLHEFGLGFDYKRTNNTLDFSAELDLPVYTKAVNLSQFVLFYQCNFDQNPLKLSFDTAAYWSPGKMLPDQASDLFAAMRAHAKNYYIYLQLGLSQLYRLPKDFSLSLILKGQISSAALLPSEQFGIGGYSTVRGYDERTANGDDGVLAKVEFRTPPFSIFKIFPHGQKTTDSLELLGFFDYGKVYLDRAIAGELKSQYLIGVGPGLRYIIDPYLSVRLDWGFKLHRYAYMGSSSNNKWHFNITAHY
jgi:hemolysin activation/secretion protein